jgi:hypothetical protein
MKTSKIYNVPYFQFAYVRTQKDMYGMMHPFQPHWWVQYLGNGASAMFDTKAECLAWIKEWDEIGEEQAK